MRSCFGTIPPKSLSSCPVIFISTISEMLTLHCSEKIVRVARLCSLCRDRGDEQECRVLGEIVYKESEDCVKQVGDLELELEGQIGW